jgi:stage IV sporulation protein FA
MDVKKRRQQRINQLVPSHQSWQEWRTQPTRNRFLYKCLICLILYGLIWTIFQLDEHSYAQRVQRAITAAMNNSFDYDAMNRWYQDHIGHIPTVLPIFEETINDYEEIKYMLPVIDQYEKLTINQTGIMDIRTAADHTVISIGRGLVVNVAKLRNNEMTVNVLYSNGIMAIYAGLVTVSVEKNNWLEKGTVIGHTDNLYFALKKGDQYVNPRDVISFD